MWDWLRVFNGYMCMYKYLCDWIDFFYGRIEELIERERERKYENEKYLVS